MAKVFVSYSRKDIDFAKRLTGELQKRDFDFWVDWEGIPPSVDWWKEIEKGIEEADYFLFLISPDSATSKVCGQEIDAAVKNGKRIIPVVVREIEWQQTPPQLGHLNYIFFSRTDDFDTALQKLLTALQTDYEWVATHRRLQVKALEWERKKKENSLLLRGKDLQDAEFQLATNTSKEPHPTDLQREHVFASRKAADRQRRITTAISVVVAIALALLAAFGFYQANQATIQKNNAQTQARLSRAGELAAQSNEIRSRDYQLSLLLGVEGYRLADKIETRRALYDSLNANPLIRILSLPSDHENVIAVRSDGKIAASVDSAHQIILWDMQTRQQVGNPLKGHQGSVDAMMFSPDGNFLASSGCVEIQQEGYPCSRSEVFLWNVNTQTLIGSPNYDLGGPVKRFGFTSDGKTVAYILSKPFEGNSQVVFVNTTTLDPASEPISSEGMPVDVVFNSDGTMIAILEAAPESRILLFGGDPLTLIDQFDLDYAGTDDKVLFSPDRKTILFQSWFDGVSVMDLETREWRRLNSSDDDTYMTSAAAFNADGNTLATSRLVIGSGAGNDMGEIILWNMQTLKPIGKRLTGHTGWVAGLAFTPDGTLVSYGLDKKAATWDVPLALSMNEGVSPLGAYIFFESDSQDIYSIYKAAFLSDKKTILLNRGTGQIDAWDSASQTVRKQFSGNNFYLSQDQKTAVMIGEDVITLWNAETDQTVNVSIKTSDLADLILTSDQETLITSDLKGDATVWNISDPSNPVGEILSSNTGTLSDSPSLALNSAGTMLAMSMGSKITLWDMAERQQILPAMEGDLSIMQLAFTQDGARLISLDNKNVKVWNTETHALDGEPFAGGGFTLSADGKTLAIVTPNGQVFNRIVLWDIATHQPLGQPLTGHAHHIADLSFGADDNFLVSISGTGSVIVWNLNPQSWIDQACYRAGRNFTLTEWSLYFPGEDYRATCDSNSLAANVLPIASVPPLPTAVPPAEAPATEAPSAPMFFVEDFSGGVSNDWSQSVGGPGSEKMDKLTVTADGPVLNFSIGVEYMYVYYFYQPHAYDDVRLKLSATNHGSNSFQTLLVCRATDEGWYEFAVQGDGLWFLYNYDKVNNEYRQIGDGGALNIKTGSATNEIQMDCIGDQISLFVNGEELKGSPIVDSTYKTGKVGFSASSLTAIPVNVDVNSVEISEP